MSVKFIYPKAELARSFDKFLNEIFADRGMNLTDEAPDFLAQCKS